MFNFETKLRMKCSLCGDKFEGYNILVCNKCMDKQKPGEDWLVFLARMKEELKEGIEPAKKPYFKLSPELADGEHWVPMDNIDTVLEYVKEWCADCKDSIGESFTIEVIEMTDAEIEALPDI